MNSLQALTDAWGRWMAHKAGTTCNYTSSTVYSDHGQLDQYHEYQCDAIYSSISYSTPSMADGSKVIPSQSLTNNTQVEQSQTFNWSSTTSTSFTWDITENLMVGLEVTGSAGVPLVAEGKVTATVQLTLSSTQSKTETNDQTWSVSNPVNVPAQSEVVCQSIISTNRATMDFTALTSITGSVAVWYKDKVHGHWLWFYPIGSVLRDITMNDLIDWTGYQVLNQDAISAAASGTCVGSYGVNVVTTYTETELQHGSSSKKSEVPDVVTVYDGSIAGT